MNMYKYLIALVIVLMGSTQVLSFLGGRTIGEYEPEYANQSGSDASSEPSASLVTSGEKGPSLSAAVSAVSTAPVASAEFSVTAKEALHANAVVLKYMTAKAGLQIMKQKIDLACRAMKPDISDDATPNIGGDNNEPCKQEKTLQRDAIRDVLREPKSQQVDPADRDMLIKYLTEILV